MRLLNGLDKNLIFLLGTPLEMASAYLKVMAKLFRLLKEKDIHKKNTKD
jgi:mannitol/fructose-specific phosphotransferase system IIA component (Ntr-type)